MATTSSQIHNGSNGSNGNISSFEKTVCLHDWWLIRAENGFNGKVLAVGGFTSKGFSLGTARIFSSAPIVKRYDLFTLQTADGITVLIKGYINKIRTHENGISLEVCNHFLIGFPFNWEVFSHQCKEGSVPTNVLLQSGESEGKDPAVNYVVEASAEVLDSFNIELVKGGDISKEDKADADTSSKTLRYNRTTCSTQPTVSIDQTLKDQKVQKFSNVNSIKNSEGKLIPYLTSVEKLKYLSNRVHAMCGSKRKRADFCDSANTGTPAGKRSFLYKDSIPSSVDCLGTAQRTILTSPNDAPRVSANCLNSKNDAAQRDASNDCIVQPDSHVNAANPSEVESLSAECTTVNSVKENLTNENPSKVEISSANETSVPVGVRRSGRLRSVKGTGTSK